MSELTLLLLRIGFLMLMWAFVFAIVYALRSDLFGTKVRRMPSAAAGSATSPAASTPRPVANPVPAPAAGDPPARRLVITSGAKEGLELDLPDDELTIGRSSDSGLVIRDDYTSTNHARLSRHGDQWMLEDLDSTNGTFLQGKRVTSSVAVPLGASISIGTTTFELRR